MLDYTRIFEAAESDENVGFCLECGEERSGVEPDAENYPCDCCGCFQVAGAAQIILMMPIK